jgi:uncharacterized protein
LGDELVARVDLKADRHNGTLLVPGIFAEENIDKKITANALAEELRLMASWLGLEKIVVGKVGDLSAPVRQALKK